MPLLPLYEYILSVFFLRLPPATASTLPTVLILLPVTMEFATVLRTVTAAGAILLPFVVWKARSHMVDYYEFGKVHAEDDPFACSKEGYMEDELDLAYMKEHFKTATRSADCNGKRPTRLLLVDSYDSHVSGQVVQFALQNGIHVLCLPVHASHILQPLDVRRYKILSKRYNSTLHNCAYNNTSEKVDKVVF